MECVCDIYDSDNISSFRYKFIYVFSEGSDYLADIAENIGSYIPVSLERHFICQQ